MRIIEKDSGQTRYWSNKTMKGWVIDMEQIKRGDMVYDSREITELLTESEIDVCFNREHQLEHVDTIFTRLGLWEEIK